VFSTAGDVSLSAGEIPCSLFVAPNQGDSAVLSTLALQLKQNGETFLLKEATRAEACEEEEADYYQSGGVGSRVIRLCPERCALLQGDDAAILSLGASCLSQECKQTRTHVTCERF